MSDVPLYGLGFSAPAAGVEESGKGTLDVEESRERDLTVPLEARKLCISDVGLLHSY